MPITRRGLFKRAGQGAAIAAAVGLPVSLGEPKPAPPAEAADYRPRVPPLTTAPPVFSASYHYPCLAGTFWTGL